MNKKSIIILLFLITLSSIILVNFGMKSTAEECKDCKECNDSVPISTEPGNANDCPMRQPLKIDTSNPQVITAGSTIVFKVLDGGAPFTWGDPGNGYTWVYGNVVDPTKPKIKATNERSNILQCASGT